jgi:hypothetical protein
MKTINSKIIWCTVFLWSTISGLTPVLKQSTQSDNLTDKWELAMMKERTSIYVRNVNVDGEELRETKAVKHIDAPLTAVIREMQGSNEIWYCLGMVETVNDLEVSDDGSTWSGYMLIDLPWPLGKQDLVMCTKYHSETASKVRIESRSCSGGIPEKRRVKRMTHFRSTWILEAVDSHSTQLTYIAQAKGKSKAPRWIVDPIVHNNLVDMLVCIEGRSQEIALR